MPSSHGFKACFQNLMIASSFRRKTLLSLVAEYLEGKMATAVSLDDCWFYHSNRLPGLGPVTGQWDMRGKVPEYTGNINLSGRTFLDVGAASGFLTFEAERLGASVTSFDAESASNTSTYLASTSLTKTFFVECGMDIGSPTPRSIPTLARFMATSTDCQRLFPHMMS